MMRMDCTTRVSDIGFQVTFLLIGSCALLGTCGKLPPMSPEELREKIRVAAINFTEEVSAIFGEAFASVAAEFQTGSFEPKPAAHMPEAPRPTPARKEMKPAKAPKPAKPAKAAKDDKRNRRSANELDKAGTEVIKLLTSAKRGMRIEEINKQLGTSTRELMRPIQKLLSQGKIKKSGERRATSYYV